MLIINYITKINFKLSRVDKTICLNKRFCPTVKVKKLANITDSLVQNWKKVYDYVMKGDSLHALIRLEQSISLAPQKAVFFRSSIVTSDEKVIKVMS